MNRNHKGFPIVCSLLIFSLLLAACQSATPTPTGAVSPTETPQDAVRPTRTTLPAPSVTPSLTPTPLPHLAVDPSSLRGVTIDFWHPWRGDLSERVGEAVRQFNQENQWGIRVRERAFNSAPGLYDAFDALPASSPGDDAPEVVAAAPEHMARWMQSERVVGLDDYLRHAEWGFRQEELTAFRPVFWQQDQISGLNGPVQIGVPAVRSGRMLFYNQTWANELGFQRPPATPDEFRAQACAAARENNAGEPAKHFTGGWLIDVDALTLLSWLDAFGAQVLPESGDGAYAFESKESEEAVIFLRQMFDQGCAWEGRSPIPHAYFADRMALFYSGTLQDLPLQGAEQIRQNSGDRWLVIPYPTGSGEGIIYSQGYSYGLTASTPERQLAGWLFVRWMSRPHNQALLAEVWPSFPVTTSAEGELADYRNNFPWSMILPLQDTIKAAPSLPTWPVVRVVLQDAFMLQLFRLPIGQMENMLTEIDQTVRELLLQQQIER